MTIHIVKEIDRKRDLFDSRSHFIAFDVVGVKLDDLDTLETYLSGGRVTLNETVYKMIEYLDRSGSLVQK